MNPQEQNGAYSATIGLPSVRQLVVFGILLPAVVAATNQLVLDRLSFSPSLRPWLYPWMIVTTAITSWSIGQFISLASFAWTMFAWNLALLNLLTFAACVGQGPLPYYFGYVLVSAQISLLTLWAILSPVSWQWRLPGVLVAVPALILLASSFAGPWFSSAEPWKAMMVLSALVMVLVCTGLHWFAFYLQNETAPQFGPHDHTPLRARQFGLKHILVWAAAMAPLLIVAQSVEYLSLYEVIRHSILPAILVSLSLATVSLLAIWAVLGTGLWLVRLTALALLPPALAFGLERYGELLRPPLGAPWNWRVPILRLLWNMENRWTIWFWLNAALLAALLLFLRARGYRLMRRSD